MRLLIVFLLPLLLFGADNWRRYRYGQFEVLTGAGREPGRELLNQLVQVRSAVGQLVGRDVEAVWPFRIVQFGSKRDARNYPVGVWKMGRDAWTLGLVKGAPPPIGELARLLLESGVQRMPAEIESGLLAVLSTLQVEGTRITLGLPVPEPRLTRDWARIHLLAVSPSYGGRVRVFFSNLRQGADFHTAYGNSFGKTLEEIEAEVDRYIAGAAFPTRKISGAAVSTRDFSARDFDDSYPATVVADLLDGEASRAAFEAILQKYPESAEALEGAGRYRKAVTAGSQSARCYVEFGKLFEQPARAHGAWMRAATLNPRWAEPYVLMAGIGTNAASKIRNLTEAAKRDPRNPAYWERLARLYEEARQFTKATQAWGGAMRAAPNPEERERYYQARMAVEDKRGDRFSQERADRIEDREIQRRRLRDEWREMIEGNRSSEETPAEGEPADPDIVEWWDDPRPKETVRGELKQVDCISGLARLRVMAAGGEVTQVLVRDPAQIVILGGGETATLGCGVQDPPRRVSVEYYVEPDARLKSAGDVVVIEFR